MFGSFKEKALEFQIEKEIIEIVEVDSGQALLKAYKILQWSSFLEELANLPRVDDLSMFSLFTFEPLYRLQLSLSKLEKGCMIKYLPSDRPVNRKRMNR